MKKYFKIIKKLKKYLIEIVLLSIAFVIALVSLISYQNNVKNDDQNLIETHTNENAGINEIKVDIEGAVKKPGVYQVKPLARIKQVVDLSGGLSQEADFGYFQRNFNLARYVTDQEKIYVPTVNEVVNGYFLENKQIINLNSPINIESNTQDFASNLISINTGTVDELDTLPGVGASIAQKIINNRPYEKLEELIDKKIVNKTVFNQIKPLIIL